MNRIDPDVADAMNNARALAAELRALKQRLAALGPQPDLAPAGQLRAQIADLRQDIRGIADRAVMDVDALLWILAEEHKLRQHYRRKPPGDMLAKALGRSVGQAERELHEAHVAATAAQDALRRATPAATAAAAATRIYRLAA